MAETTDKNLAAAQLAVEAGWRRIAANQQALEGMRSRSMALLSVMVVASSIITGTGLVRRPPSQPLSQMTGWETAGVVLFVAYVVVTTVVVIHVASPTDLPVSDVLLMLSAAQALNTTVHVYENHVHNLDDQIKAWSNTLERRGRLLKIGLVAALLGVVGFGLLWVHGTEVEASAAAAAAA